MEKPGEEEEIERANLLFNLFGKLTCCPSLKWCITHS